MGFGSISVRACLGEFWQTSVHPPVTETRIEPIRLSLGCTKSHGATEILNPRRLAMKASRKARRRRLFGGSRETQSCEANTSESCGSGTSSRREPAKFTVSGDRLSVTHSVRRAVKFASTRTQFDFSDGSWTRIVRLLRLYAGIGRGAIILRKAPNNP